MLTRLALLLALVAPACGGDDAPTVETTPEDACLDFADTVGDLCDRCFPDDPSAYQGCYDDFLQSVANGNCANVISIRDIDELYNQCLPSLRSVACTIAFSGDYMFDSSCLMQFHHR